jgi:RNA polymerase sigma-70 factor, ECF subfamily
MLFRSDYARLVRSLSIAFDGADAADAVQEAFLDAFKRWSRVVQYEDPIGWIRRVAINRLLNEQRNRRKRSEIEEHLPPIGHVDLPTDAVSLRSTLASLPLQMRLTISLFYLEDLTGQEIADLLGVSPSTVRSNLHDARQRLRLDLTEESV